MSDAITKAKEIAKKAGVKGFRKLRLKAVKHIIGRQGAWLAPAVANKLIDDLLALGFGIRMMDTLRALAAKGNLDMVTIEGFGRVPEVEEIPVKLDAKAMTEAPAMREVEAFGLNPQIVTETLSRVSRAMREDGLTPADITGEVLAAYMEADRKTQERLFMDYMTNPRTRKGVQGAILDILEARQ
ncbi:hypothetical protein [Aeromonas aquatica]|uniref:hypothetical protein n=1 Tax=Aeromonas aquatica TaxID=558964 RepID=UPI00068BF676|nr:hypothetical protein [Aeromonas aquatica]